MSTKSRYVLVVDNISSATTSKDIKYEFEMAGNVRDVVRDAKARCALVEFERSSDATYAWKKMDGRKLDGRRWQVDYATRKDFDFLGWKWFEGRSPSPSRSPSRGRSPTTPYNNDDKRGQSGSVRSRSRSRSYSR